MCKRLENNKNKNMLYTEYNYNVTTLEHLKSKIENTDDNNSSELNELASILNTEIINEFNHEKNEEMENIISSFSNFYSTRSNDFKNDLIKQIDVILKYAEEKRSKNIRKIDIDKNHYNDKLHFELLKIENRHLSFFKSVKSGFHTLNRAHSRLLEYTITHNMYNSEYKMNFIENLGVEMPNNIKEEIKALVMKLYQQYSSN